MIQPMQGWGWYELQRQRAEEATAGNKPPPEDPDHIPWAPGCVEYEQAMREREERQRKPRPGSRSSRPRPPQRANKVPILGRGSLNPGSMASNSALKPRYNPFSVQNFGAVMAECKFAAADLGTTVHLVFLEKPTPKIPDRKRNRAGQQVR